MSKHPSSVTLQPLQLARKLTKLRYDRLAEYLGATVCQLYQDANADRMGGRLQLATALDEAAELMGKAVERLDHAWRISEPYMKRS